VARRSGRRPGPGSGSTARRSGARSGWCSHDRRGRAPRPPVRSSCRSRRGCSIRRGRCRGSAGRRRAASWAPGRSDGVGATRSSSETRRMARRSSSRSGGRAPSPDRAGSDYPRMRQQAGWRERLAGALSVSGLIFLAASFLRSRGLPTGFFTTATERGGGAVRDAQDGCAVGEWPDLPGGLVPAVARAADRPLHDGDRARRWCGPRCTRRMRSERFSASHCHLRQAQQRPAESVVQCRPVGALQEAGG